jgi:hypothetical protein
VISGLAAYAAHWQRMRLPNEHGISRLTTLQRFAEATGKRHPDLDGPSVDPAAMYLYRWWLELHSARGGNGFGPEPISYTELDAWARLTRRSPTAEEVTALRTMDDAYLSMYAEEAAKRHPKGST